MISFESKITQQLLNYFFLNPQEKLYVNELARKLNLDKRNLVKKIKELQKEGILDSEKRGNLKFYFIVRTYPLYKEYKNIFLKTAGLVDKLKKILRALTGVKEAYIYGSFATGKMGAHSDIDLLVIGSHNILQLQKKLNKLQSEIDREINAVNMGEREFKNRLKKKDNFIKEVLSKEHISLLK